MTEFLVERYWPGVRDDDVRQASQRLAAAAVSLTHDGAAVRYLGSSLVAVDEMVVCQFVADCEDTVIQLNALAGVSYDRIVVAVGFPQSSRGILAHQRPQLGP